MMEFDTFSKWVADDMRKLLGENYSVEITSVMKNNGVKQMCLSIKEAEGKIEPIVYLQPLYKAYKDGSSIVRLTQIVKARIENNAFEKKIPDMDKSDYECVKDRIVIQVINYEMNKELLREISHKKVMDLAVTFRFCWEPKEKDMMVSTLDNETFEPWQISLEELYEQAIENSARLFPPTCGRIETMLLGWDEDETTENDGNKNLPQMHVFTNELGINGASVIFYPGELKKLAEMLGGDLLLLPSSIHEFLVMKYMDGMNLAAFREMVQKVNLCDVPEEDVLSNSVYRYKQDNDKLEIV